MKIRRINQFFPDSKKAKPIKIMSDMMIADPRVGEGRPIPVLLLDLESRSDVEDLINHQQDSPPGDVESTWTRKITSKNIGLMLSFSNPVITQFIIELDIIKYGAIINLIVGSESLYVQKHIEDQNGIERTEAAKLLVEVPHGGFEDKWPNLWKKNLIKKFRKEGANKRKATEMWKKYFDQMAEMAKIRTGM